MDLNTYQKLSERTLPDYKEDLKGAISNYAIGLAEEAGECLGPIKKTFHHGHPLDRDKIEKELGDLLHYAAGIATMLGITLENVAIGNIEKLKKRYPNGFSVEDSIKRVDTV